MTPLLETRGLARRFRVSRGLFAPKATLHALNGVDLQLMRGKVLGVVGESGCGKSTLAKILLRLLEPSEGEVLLDGRPIAQIGRMEFTRRVQPVFQDPFSSLNPRQTVAEIVGMPLRVHRLGSGAEVRARVAAILDMVGLPGRFAGRYPKELSGGQRQRVAIARALVMKPELVICDEPTSALDASVQSQILNLLMELKAELGLTYVFISHNLAVVEHLADEVAVMYLGRIVERGSTARVFDEPRHPYTQALLRSALTVAPGAGVPDIGLGLAFPDPLNLPAGCAFAPRCPRAQPACERTRPAAVPARGDGAACLLTEGVPS